MDCHWLVIADAARATIYGTDLRFRALWEIATLIHPESRLKTSELMSDEEGKMRQSGRMSVRSGGVSPQTDAHEHEADAFALQIAQRLEAGHAANAYDRLLLAAPPKLLGQIRGHLPDPVSKRILLALGKRLCDVPQNDLLERIHDHLPDEARRQGAAGHA